MKGIVFNLLEEAVTEEFGADTWDSLLDSAGLDGAYTSLGSYDDAQMVQLVNVASSALQVPPEAVLQWFGKRAMPMLASRYEVFFRPYQHTRDFLLTLNHIIHPEVNKLYPGASTPVFDFDTSDPEILLMGYSSQRKLCALAAGFVEGAAQYYGEQVIWQQSRCMHRGDAKCLFELRFEREGLAG